MRHESVRSIKAEPHRRVAYAGLRDRPLLLPLAVVLALPLLWLHGLAVLVALTPLLRQSARRDVVASSQDH